MHLSFLFFPKNLSLYLSNSLSLSSLLSSHSFFLFLCLYISISLVSLFSMFCPLVLSLYVSSFFLFTSRTFSPSLSLSVFFPLLSSHISHSQVVETCGSGSPPVYIMCTASIFPLTRSSLPDCVWPRHTTIRSRPILRRILLLRPALVKGGEKPCLQDFREKCACTALGDDGDDLV